MLKKVFSDSNFTKRAVLRESMVWALTLAIGCHGTVRSGKMSWFWSSGGLILRHNKKMRSRKYNTTSFLPVNHRALTTTKKCNFSNFNLHLLHFYVMPVYYDL